MVTWSEFEAKAPRVAEIFHRRHAATSNLCFLGTVRRDGSPRVSPMEPRIFEGQLWLVGMPDTLKFADLARDPRCTIHTATVDTQVTEGDAKLSGVVHNVEDLALQQRWLQDMFDQTGFDMRGETISPFYALDIREASSVEVAGDHLDITVWREGETERVLHKH